MHIDVRGSIALDEPSLVRIAARERDWASGYVMEADVREDISEGRLVRVLEDWTPQLAPSRSTTRAGKRHLQPSVPPLSRPRESSQPRRVSRSRTSVRFGRQERASRSPACEGVRACVRYPIHPESRRRWVQTFQAGRDHVFSSACPITRNGGAPCARLPADAVGRG